MESMICFDGKLFSNFYIEAKFMLCQKIMKSDFFIDEELLRNQSLSFDKSFHEI